MRNCQIKLECADGSTPNSLTIIEEGDGSMAVGDIHETEQNGVRTKWVVTSVEPLPCG